MTKIDDLIHKCKLIYEIAEGDNSIVMARDDYRIMAAALSEQRDEIERLTTERGTLLCAGTTLKPEYTPLGQIILDLEKRAERAEAERDAAMKDAERYRWLRACRAGDWDALNNLRLAQSMCGLDTAIDAAIAKGKG